MCEDPMTLATMSKVMKTLLLLMFFIPNSSVFADKIEVIDEGEIIENGTATVSKPVYTKKAINMASFVHTANGSGFFASVFVFPQKGDILVRTAHSYGIGFLANQSASVAFVGKNLGLLLFPDQSICSALIDINVSIGTSYTDQRASFSVGFGSSQMALFRFGGNTRIVMGAGFYESIIAGNVQLKFAGLRFTLGLEIPH